MRLHSGPDAVPPERWCVTLADLLQFREDVRRVWLGGGIPDSVEYPSKYHNDPQATRGDG